MNQGSSIAKRSCIYTPLPQPHNLHTMHTTRSKESTNAEDVSVICQIHVTKLGFAAGFTIFGSKSLRTRPL